MIGRLQVTSIFVTVRIPKIKAQTAKHTNTTLSQFILSPFKETGEPIREVRIDLAGSQ